MSAPTELDMFTSKESDYSGVIDADGRLIVSWELQWVPLRDLFVDYHEDFLNGSGTSSAMLSYQRQQARTGRVMASMGKRGYNPDLFGVLIGTERADGTIALGDGGTRYRFLTDAKLNLPPATLIPVLVNRWDQEREIRNYIDLNRERASLSQVDWFVAKVKLGEPDAKEIDRILVEESGHGVGHKKGGWQAVSEIQRAHRAGTLQKTVNLLRRLGWLELPRGRSQGTLGGVSRLTYLSNFDPDHALERWSAVTPQVVHMKAREFIKVGQSRAVSAAVALTLTELYNHKLRNIKRRLDVSNLIIRSSDVENDDDDDGGDDTE